MTEPIRMPAPEPIGDVIPGQPPVPITVWHVPAARAGETVSLALAERLVMNFTHGRRLVIDLTEGEQLAQAVAAARRRHVRHDPADLAHGTERAALIVLGWPDPHAHTEPYLTACAARLMLGGCVAVVLDGIDIGVNQVLIAAARAAGLTYLQHLVIAHDLTERHGQVGAGGTHLRVHSDVLIFNRSPRGDRGD